VTEACGHDMCPPGSPHVSKEENEQDEVDGTKKGADSTSNQDERRVIRIVQIV